MSEVERTSREGCEYCDESVEKVFDFSCYFYERQVGVRPPINFCPNCGRKL